MSTHNIMFSWRNKKAISIFRMKKAPYLLLCPEKVLTTQRGTNLLIILLLHLMNMYDTLMYMFQLLVSIPTTMPILSSESLPIIC